MATESFTAADGTAVRTLTNWDGACGNNGAGGGACTVQSNEASASQGNLVTGADWYTGGGIGNDQYSQATIKSTTNGVFLGVAVRCSGTDNGTNVTGYFFYSDPGDGSYIDEYSVGEFLGTIAGPGTIFAVNDLVRLEISGSSLVAKINGNTEFSISGSLITSGSPGICAHQGGATALDDWEGGDLVAGSSQDVSSIFSLDEGIYAEILGGIIVR